MAQPNVWCWAGLFDEDDCNKMIGESCTESEAKTARAVVKLLTLVAPCEPTGECLVYGRYTLKCSMEVIIVSIYQSWRWKVSTFLLFWWPGSHLAQTSSELTMYQGWPLTPKPPASASLGLQACATLLSFLSFLLLFLEVSNCFQHLTFSKKQTIRCWNMDCDVYSAHCWLQGFTAACLRVVPPVHGAHMHTWCYSLMQACLS